MDRFTKIICGILLFSILFIFIRPKDIPQNIQVVDVNDQGQIVKVHSFEEAMEIAKTQPNN